MSAAAAFLQVPDVITDGMEYHHNMTESAIKYFFVNITAISMPN